MNPNAVFSATLVTSLLLWYPSMQACLRGDLDLTPAALRYLAALTVARIGMNLLARLVSTYRTPEHQPADLVPPGAEDGPGTATPRTQPMAASPAEFDPSATAAPQRRRSDHPTEDGVGPSPLAA
jgi:hypothetical protein